MIEKERKRREHRKCRQENCDVEEKRKQKLNVALEHIQTRIHLISEIPFRYTDPHFYFHYSVSVSAGPSTPSGPGGGEATVIHSEVIVTGTHQQQPQPPIDDQPCDLRLLTPNYLREFAAESSAQQRDLIAAAAAAAAAVANAGGTSSSPLPVPIFKVDRDEAAESSYDGDSLVTAMYNVNSRDDTSISLVIGCPDAAGFFHCPNGTCDRKYKIKYSLIRHLRNECIDNRRFPCPFCKKKFSYSFILNRHILKVHKTLHC
ncbi:uncharacterized protein LOC135714683 [Ochlerotatus camptorhynchus]|uniref:uncharacterized protein LOC135714683 n=1 Tax=Ochlerotatus camptorhynchus TaxID=644619 RepID=UPI0031E18979